MNWLKRNLFLVLGVVVALGLLGFAIYFLIAKKQAVAEVTEQLNAQTEELKRLTLRDPYPNPENIEEAKKEQKQLSGFLQQVRPFFVPVAAYTNMDGATFKNLLETAIFEMERDAEKAGVGLPAKYDFTFKPQRSSVVFAPESLVPLATEVAEIKAICGVMFDARIHALNALRRMPVAKDDSGTTDYLTGRKPVTNAVTGAVLVPYEIKFQGFTPEVSSVLQGFYRSPNCFIVKNIDVQTNVVTAADASSGLTPAYFLGAPPPSPSEPAISPQEQLRRRYGLGPGSRYSPGVPSPAPPPTTYYRAAPTRRGPETVLEEHPFTVTMYVEAVRWGERTKAGRAR